MVALGRWSSYTVTVVWEFAWADSASVILYEWMSYRGGCLNRFYCSCILGLGNSCADFTSCVPRCPSVRTCIMWKQVNRFLSYMAFWFTWLVSLCWGVFTGGHFWIGKVPCWLFLFCSFRTFSSSLLHVIIAHNHLPFFKIFSNFAHFCPNFQIFCPFLTFFCPFLSFFWKLACMPLLSRKGPVIDTILDNFLCNHTSFSECAQLVLFCH